MNYAVVVAQWTGVAQVSLMSSPCMPPSEKRSGERSRISWAYMRTSKWWKTNEIARLLIIT